MLESADKILDELGQLAEYDKFAYERWNERGLHPSDEDVIKYMNDRLNLCIAELILAIENGAVKWQIRKILKKGLSRYRRIDLDTE